MSRHMAAQHSTTHPVSPTAYMTWHVRTIARKKNAQHSKSQNSQSAQLRTWFYLSVAKRQNNTTCQLSITSTQQVATTEGSLHGVANLFQTPPSPPLHTHVVPSTYNVHARASPVHPPVRALTRCLLGLELMQLSHSLTTSALPPSPSSPCQHPLPCLLLLLLLPFVVPGTCWQVNMAKRALPTYLSGPAPAACLDWSPHFCPIAHHPPPPLLPPPPDSHDHHHHQQRQ